MAKEINYRFCNLFHQPITDNICDGNRHPHLTDKLQLNKTVTSITTKNNNHAINIYKPRI